MRRIGKAVQKADRGALDPLGGEEVQTLVEEVSRTPPDVVARVRDALESK